MPSSGLKIESFCVDEPEDKVAWEETYKVIEQNSNHAWRSGMFIEWLESFVGAYNELRAQGKSPNYAANVASHAGIEEWDL
jgi:hypothetical protein